MKNFTEKEKSFQELKETLEKGFAKENRFYWIEKEEKAQRITKHEAGKLCKYFEILA